MEDLNASTAQIKQGRENYQSPVIQTHVRHYQSFEPDARATVDRELSVSTSVPQPLLLVCKVCLIGWAGHAQLLALRIGSERYGPFQHCLERLFFALLCKCQGDGLISLILYILIETNFWHERKMPSNITASHNKTWTEHVIWNPSEYPVKSLPGTASSSQSSGSNACLPDVLLWSDWSVTKS